jgi:hypothetical protein
VVSASSSDTSLESDISHSAMSRCANDQPNPFHFFSEVCTGSIHPRRLPIARSFPDFVVFSFGTFLIHVFSFGTFLFLFAHLE